MPVQIAENVYWVGAVDFKRRHFHGHTFHTQRGTTYNAYLVIDDKIALIDTVMQGFEEPFLEHISELIDPAKIDYVVANHGELDHSGSLPMIMERAPQATLVCSQHGLRSLGKYFNETLKLKTVGTGDTISLGKKSLAFLNATFLHWPDSMFTYIPEERLLIPNDAFGQHLASEERFADQIEPDILWDEARKYFANILTPFSKMILSKIEEVKKMGLAIDTIAPSHGVIWRKDPAQIIEKYMRWSSGYAKAAAIIIYETMWNSTAEMAEAIQEGILSQGVQAQLFPVPQIDHTTIIGELLESKGILLGSPTHNRRTLLNIAAISEDLIGLQPVGKLGAAFGSQGWGGGAVPILEQRLSEAGIQVVERGLTIKWRANAEERIQAVEFGKRFAQKILSALEPETRG